jgi:hypothetical protein
MRARGAPEDRGVLAASMRRSSDRLGSSERASSHARLPTSSALGYHQRTFEPPFNLVALAGGCGGSSKEEIAPWQHGSSSIWT